MDGWPALSGVAGTVEDMRARHIRDDELVTAAALSGSLGELLDRLGLSSTPGRRSHLRRRLRSLGAGTGHWQPEGRRYSRQQLADAVAVSCSYAGVLRVLGVKQAGGSQAHLARRIRGEQLDTSHFTGQAHLRGRTRGRPPPHEVLVLLPPGSNRVKSATLRRAMMESGVPHCCAACGQPPTWRGRPLTLVIDHVDGEWLDNRLANLRFLCPNCHAQTATWCRTKGP